MCNQRFFLELSLKGYGWKLMCPVDCSSVMYISKLSITIEFRSLGYKHLMANLQFITALIKKGIARHANITVLNFIHDFESMVWFLGLFFDVYLYMRVPHKKV